MPDRSPALSGRVPLCECRRNGSCFTTLDKLEPLPQPPHSWLMNESPCCTRRRLSSMLRGVRLSPLCRMQALQVLLLLHWACCILSEALRGRQTGRSAYLFPLLQVGNDLEGLGHLPCFVAAHDLAHRLVHLHHLGRHALRYLLLALLVAAEHV